MAPAFPRRRRAEYVNYFDQERQAKIRELEALQAALLAMPRPTPAIVEKIQEFIPYREEMTTRAIVAELARAQEELEDEEDIEFLLLH